ncbi:MAG: DUF5611 family protein [Candidatus Thermoplasmatota archaeon]|nr:DUF5611 family protein [Candidatus Thermoplasmatota archaeon]
MRHYPVKRGNKENLQPDNLRGLVTESFGDCSEEEGRFTASFGALKQISAWTDGKDLIVDTEMDASVPDDVAMETIRRFNDFLLRTTGYRSKERKKRAEKEHKK